MLTTLVLLAIFRAAAASDDISKYRIQATVELSDIFEADLVHYVPVNDSANLCVQKPDDAPTSNVKIVQEPFAASRMSYNVNISKETECFNLPSYSDFLSGIVCNHSSLILRDFSDDNNLRKVDFYEFLKLDKETSRIYRVGGYLGDNITLYFTYGVTSNGTTLKHFKVYYTEYSYLGGIRPPPDKSDVYYPLKGLQIESEHDALVCAYVIMDSKLPDMLCLNGRGTRLFKVEGKTLITLDLSLNQDSSQGAIQTFSGFNINLRNKTNPDGMIIRCAGVWKEKDNSAPKIFVGAHTLGTEKQEKFEMKFLTIDLNMIVNSNQSDGNSIIHLELGQKTSSIVHLKKPLNQSSDSPNMNISVLEISSAQILSPAMFDKEMIRNSIKMEIPKCMCLLPVESKLVRYLENEFLQIFAFKVSQSPEKWCTFARNKKTSVIFIRELPFHHI